MDEVSEHETQEPKPYSAEELRAIKLNPVGLSRKRSGRRFLATIDELRVELAAANERAREMAKWANCGGVPALDGMACDFEGERGHKIFGPFSSIGDRTLCEFHMFTEKLAAASARADRAEAELEDMLAAALAGFLTTGEEEAK